MCRINQIRDRWLDSTCGHNCGFVVLLGVAKVLKITDTKVKLIIGLTRVERNMFLNKYILYNWKTEIASC